jgi:hypothetical protein
VARQSGGVSYARHYQTHPAILQRQRAFVLFKIEPKELLQILGRTVFAHVRHKKQMSMELFDGDAEEIAYYKSKLEELRTRLELILKNYRPVMNGEVYLSGEDVCKLLHISKRTLQQYRDDNILPYVQIGGKIIFRQSDLLEILEQNYISNKVD